MKTIDATPTWSGVLPLCIEALIHGNFEGRKAAMQELTRMAQLADLTVAAEQERGLTWSMDNYPPKWERPVLLALVKAILKRGHAVSIWMDDEPIIEGSTDLEEIIRNLAAGDQDELLIGDDLGWFSLIYNNGSEHEPMVVISDYSANELCEDIYRDTEQEVES
jgi:hypothetical protein